MPYLYALVIVGLSLVGLPNQAQSQQLPLFQESVSDFEQGSPPCRGIGTFSKDCVPLSISGNEDDCRESYEVFANGSWITHRDNCDRPEISSR